LSDTIRQRVERLELPFDERGYDPWGISRRHLGVFYGALGLLRRYFDVHVHGIGNVPPRGRAMLVGNHSGGIAMDGAMVIASAFFDMDPPRLAQGMAEKFINRFPVASVWASRTGHFTGLPEHAQRLLEEDRLLLVFPEGAHGTAKLFPERNSLVRFGTGFLRLALETKTPIVPFGFVGGGEAIPTVRNLTAVGRLFGVPYVPVTPWIAPLPRPVRMDIRFGAPMHPEGTGAEDDERVQKQVDEVRDAIARLIDESLLERGEKPAHAAEAP